MTGTDQISAADAENSSSIEITLRIWHARDDPGEISQAMGLTPTYSYKAGERRVSPKGKPLASVHRETLWCYDIEVSKDSSLSEALDAVSALLESHEQQLQRLRARGFRLECYVGLFLEGDRTEMLSSTQMSQYAHDGVDLVLSIYAPRKAASVD